MPGDYCSFDPIICFFFKLKMLTTSAELGKPITALDDIFVVFWYANTIILNSPLVVWIRKFARTRQQQYRRNIGKLPVIPNKLFVNWILLNLFELYCIKQYVYSCVRTMWNNWLVKCRLMACMYVFLFYVSWSVHIINHNLRFVPYELLCRVFWNTSSTT